MQSNAWCLSKRINVEEMLMVIIIEEKYKSKVDVNKRRIRLPVHMSGFRVGGVI